MSFVLKLSIDIFDLIVGITGWKDALRQGSCSVGSTHSSGRTTQSQNAHKGNLPEKYYYVN